MSESAAQRKPRPRDAQATKAILLRAATAEFADHGLAGARIDRIAERAGANKRLLYVYFGDKNQVFEAVVQDQAEAVLAAAPLADGDLCAFAAARYDYVLANPEARRIATWRSFEQAEPTEAEVDSFRDRVEAVAAAQRAGKLRADLPAVDLFAIVLRMTESWLSAPPALKAVGGDPLDGERLREHRTAMLEAVRSIVEPRPAAVTDQLPARRPR
ncbi:TetR family transcriptional regulator [Actinacidiphila yeochonensis]|uniref:TetR family transcriptional regulator n=1 Tax=Actinacidiphila yeochonensis TaxID=89050 RepID=UPI00068E080D|nr:TetR family transcriptional regulator [Actinacidiphila yeochonensis]